ncbi:MAG: hypothetical protein K5705_04010 [Oscillospiraceae bacterium]|nr:hypothetical protein [Oscillospiraceae bacterium]MCR4759419.1 hypothetical protein [Oscillospiraceae bacterium]
MKMKKLAGIILSGCLAAAALGSVTANAGSGTYSDPANGYYGTYSYKFENRYIGISQRRLVSRASGQVLTWSSKITLTNGGTHAGKGGYGYRETEWVPSNLIKSNSTVYYKISRSGVRSYLFTKKA